MIKMFKNRQKRIPSRLRLRVRFWTCLFLAAVSLFFGMGLCMDVLLNDAPVWPKLAYGLFGIAVYLISFHRALGVPRLRTKYYEVVTQGMITAVPPPLRYPNGTYMLRASVKGINEAGEMMVQDVPLSPNQWRSVQVGMSYPLSD